MSSDAMSSRKDVEFKSMKYTMKRYSEMQVKSANRVKKQEEEEARERRRENKYKEREREKRKTTQWRKEGRKS